MRLTAADGVEPQSAYTIKSVVKAFRVVELFGRNQPSLTIASIASQTQLNRVTAFRLCSTLAELGYLRRNLNSSYSLGMRALMLANAALGTLELPELAMPILKGLQEEIAETVNLGVLEETEIVYLIRLRSDQLLSIQLQVGSRIPFYASSLGKAIAAFLPLEERSALSKRINLRPLTDHTIQTKSALEEQLSDVRRDGYAVNLEELAPGIRGIAAPVFDQSGRPVAAVNVALTRLLTREQIIDEFAAPMLKAARDISAVISH